MLEAITKIALGKMDELPDRVRRAAEIAKAEISALDQLWNLLRGPAFRRPGAANSCGRPQTAL
jgi:hypothetical protein